MISTAFVSWQTEAMQVHTTCSPNLSALLAELRSRWQMTTLGCYAARPIRGGVAPSSHSAGAAIDVSYGAGAARRALAVDVIIPWLIDHSAELHVQAIHDYIGCRIWRAGRTGMVADATSGWWRAQPTGNGMGEAWATYLHVETTPAGWSDATPIPDRFPAPAPIVTPPPPIPDPPSTEEDEMLAIYRPTFPLSGDYDPAWFVVFASGRVRRATNADVKLAGILGVPTVDLDSADQYDDLLQLSGSTWAPRPTDAA